MPAVPPRLDEAALEALATPAAHPHDASATTVEVVQTHLSHVFLTGRRVYKFRKDVDLGFVCFDTRAARNEDCLREVALNRRLAPDVYLGVAPLEAGPGGARVGAVSEGLVSDGPAPEHCVVMRRLPEGRDALSLLAAGRLTRDQIQRVAHVMARFHAAHGLGAPAPFDPAGWLEHCGAPVRDNFRLLALHAEELVPHDVLAAAQERALGFLAEHAERFEARRRDGRVVDGHGDLHLQHVWFETDDAEPLVIDCLEFSEALRRIDAASEVAFLAMDLVYRGSDGLAAHFLASYAAERDDFDLFTVVDWFASYRAAVRAKVAAIAAVDASIAEAQRAAAARSARDHLGLAASLLAPRRGASVIAVGGVVGAGKSTLSTAVAETTGGVVISSDRVRKHRLGLAPGERAPPEAYSRAGKAEVYAGLLERAEPVVGSGRVAVLDATWGRRADRDALRAWADRLGLRAVFVEARCGRDEAIRRLEARAAAARDPSDAGPELYAASVAGFEPASEWPDPLVIETDRGDASDRVRELAALLGLPTGWPRPGT
jgi:aminoglycoside phosphotransferase family enzyme/predicted kinase